ncbi:MAG: ECF transporter S component [Oscillospiraceae bacterium]|nr:ECF transporter S component [Oscillospiraceae bacterium]
MNDSHIKTKTLTGVALFTAIVVVLQLLGSFIRFGPFSISLVLIPIVVGAAMYGATAGAWLGFVFGVAVLLSGDAAVFMPINPIGTVVTVLAKGTLAGFCAGLVYRALEKKSRYVAVVAAAIVCPVVNTGAFLLGCLFFFLETVSGWGRSMGFENVGTYMIVGLVGLNFLVEMTINIILSPVVLRLIRIGKHESAETEADAV